MLSVNDPGATFRIGDPGTCGRRGKTPGGRRGHFYEPARACLGRRRDVQPKKAKRQNGQIFRANARLPKRRHNFTGGGWDPPLTISPGRPGGGEGRRGGGAVVAE